MTTNNSFSVFISTDEGDILNPSINFTSHPTAPAVTVEEAAIALRAKLAGMSEVTSIVSGDDCLFIYVSNAKVWVDLPPVFPKGPDGYPTQMVLMRARSRHTSPLQLQVIVSRLLF